MSDNRPRSAACGPVGVISAHLDDAVLSCSSVITAGSLVVTVFAAGPGRVDRVAGWNAAAGFHAGDDVSAIRAKEDDDALSQLGARGHRLPFWEAQYRLAAAPRRPLAVRISQRLQRSRPRVDERIAESVLNELDSLIRASDLSTWIAPLGISHPDHAILGSILPRLARQNATIDWHLYDDLPYWVERPGERDAAHRRLERVGFRLEPTGTITDAERKLAAVACYRSQVVALGDRVQTAIDHPELIYRLVSDRA